MDLNMIPFIIDPCLYFLFRNGEFIAASRSYVDDLLRARDDHFTSIVDKTQQRFDTGGNEMSSITFAGININRTADYTYTIDQSLYEIELTQLRSDATFKEFFSIKNAPRLDLKHQARPAIRDISACTSNAATI